MMTHIDQLPRDGNALREACATLIAERDTAHSERDTAFRQRDAVQAERDAIKARLDALAVEHECVKRELRMRMKVLFGPRSERMSDADLVLFAELIRAEKDTSDKAKAQEAEACEIRHVAAHTRKVKNGRGVIPAHLPREDVVHDLCEEEKKCPCCGEPRVCIGEDVSEQLECVPAKVKVLRHVKKKYACPGCRKGVAVALPPPQAIEKCKAASGLLAMIGVSKFADHLPFYRQEGILRRGGVLIPRSTQCDWMRQMAVALAPLTALMQNLVLESGVVGGDDTPVKMLDPGRNRTKESRIWVYVSGGMAKEHKYAVFDFSPSREGKWPRQWLKDYAKKGQVKYLQADAFAGYDALYLPPPDPGTGGTIIEVGCWAHARRKFYDARATDPARCLPILALIKNLYAVEARSRELKEDTVAIAARRHEHAGPVLARIRALLDVGLPHTLPKSDVGEAFRYALNHWVALTRYIENGLLLIDNNECERALRAVAVGRKNWLFFGSEGGGATAATMFTLIGSARLHEIEPWAYLKDVLDRIATVTAAQLHDLLPDRWVKAHPEHILPLGR